MTGLSGRWPRRVLPVALLLLPLTASAQPLPQDIEYEHDETRELVALVNDASVLIRNRGEEAFRDFAVPGSRWRQHETYVFVLALDGTMVVHPDPDMEGRNQLELRDINGKPIIRGLLDAATMFPGKPEGWYHYQWPVPGALLPRWKSSYVRAVAAPDGTQYVVGSGLYNDRMERSFVVHAVTDAVGQIEQHGRAAFPLLHDPTGPFLAKDTYVFVIDSNGVDLVNPAFPNLEGRPLLDVRDTRGKPLVREMLDVVRTAGAGWVDYMWPKPGDSVSTQKSTYVRRARIGDEWVMVGCGVYLADAPRAEAPAGRLNAPALMTLVRDGAALLARQGEGAYPEFRMRGSKWLRDDTYMFVWSMDGVRVFHAADPAGEGQDVREMKDILGRPIGRLFLDAARSAAGEGWVHYMFPEPGDLFPTWKSTFVKRVAFPSGQQHLVGAGIYNMKMDRAFIVDVVDRATALVAQRGREAFGQLRDRTGTFFFLDTYIFVDSPDGVELVNGAQPSLEGRNLLHVRDVNGKALVRDYIAAALQHGSAWVEYHWYRPGDNTPAPKQAYVRRVTFGGETFIVGSGFYVEKEQEGAGSR